MIRTALFSLLALTLAGTLLAQGPAGPGGNEMNSALGTNLDDQINQKYNRGAVNSSEHQEMNLIKKVPFEHWSERAVFTATVTPDGETLGIAFQGVIEEIKGGGNRQKFDDGEGDREQITELIFETDRDEVDELRFELVPSEGKRAIRVECPLHEGQISQVGVFELQSTGRHACILAPLADDDEDSEASDR